MRHPNISVSQLGAVCEDPPLENKNAKRAEGRGAIARLLRLELSHCTMLNVSRVMLLHQFYCDLSNPTVCKFIMNRLILRYQDYCDFRSGHLKYLWTS